MIAIVFDLGGTHLRCASYSRHKLKNVQKLRIDHLLTGRPDEAVWYQLTQLMADYIHSLNSPDVSSAPIILSFPGPIDHCGQIIQAPTLVGDSQAFPDLSAELERLTGLKMYILNDISAAAWYFSQSITVDRFMVITVSSGIGSKIFDHNHKNGVLDDIVYAGEIGHTTVDFSSDAVLCDCGGRGHLGAIASGRGVERRGKQQAYVQAEAFARSLCARKFKATAENLNNEDHIVPAVLAGDAWATELLTECTRILGQTLAIVCLAAGIQRIVIIGGFALALGETYLAILRREFASSVTYQVFKNCYPNPNEFFQLGDPKEEACLLGAATYAEKRLRQAS